jgi:TatD DNase family protein
VLAQQVRRIPLDRIVLETDSPYLVPNGFKHRRNTPESIPLIAQFLANLFGLDVSEVARQTTQNAERLFPGLTAEVAST